MKRKIIKISVFLFFLMMILGKNTFLTYASEVDAQLMTSGKCGDNSTWQLDSKGTLTISGTGYVHNNSSWTDDFKEKITDIVIEQGITGIGYNAFSDCRNLVSIEIPSSVTTIGERAFAGCSSLKSVEVPSGVTRIGRYAFYQCTNLVHIEIPSSVTSIELCAFVECSSLLSIKIPSSVTSIGDGVFQNCSGLTSMEILSSITEIGQFMFVRCENLTSIEIPSSVTKIGQYAFYECESLINVYYGGSEQQWNSITIDLCNEELETASIHYNYKKEINTDNGQLDNDSSTNENAENKNYEILVTDAYSNDCVYIGSEYNPETKEFEETEITCKFRIPKINLTSTEIVKINSEIYDYIYTIIEDVEREILEYGYPSTSDEIVYYWALNDNILSLVIRNSSYPDMSGGYEFKVYNIDILTETLVSDETVIEKANFSMSKFYEITKQALGSDFWLGWEFDNPNFKDDYFVNVFDKALEQTISEENIKQTIPYINEKGELCVIAKKYSMAGADYYWNDHNLVDFEHVFHFAMKASEIKLPFTTTGKCGHNLVWKLDSKGVLTINGTGKMYNYLSTSYDGVLYPTPWNDVSKCITKIVLEPGITTIGDYAFYFCENASSISIPEGVESIGKYAFYGCKSLLDIKIPDSVYDIGKWAFYACVKLESIHLPKGLVDIEDFTFGLCENLLKLEMPNSICSIGRGAFTQCESLKSINIPEGVECIESGTFNFCENLEYIRLPNSLKGIEENAFRLCMNMKYVIMSNNLELIEEDAFESCYNLSDIYYTGKKEEWEIINIYKGNDNLLDATIHYECDNQQPSEDSIELKVYTAFPESTIGTEQDVKIQFSLYVNGELSPIEEYSIGIGTPSVIESTEMVDDNGSRIITFKGLKQGVSDITFTENSTGATITISIQVEDKCNYFRCSAFPIPDESSGSIYVADYSCTVDENGNHDIFFNAYNTSYSYGVVEVYNEKGSLIKLVPLDPGTDGSGIEKVDNHFKYVWDDIKDLFDGDTPFYIKDAYAKCTPVPLENIPENAEIVITSDGLASDFVTLYTGVDVFVRTVFAASSIDLKMEGQIDTVKKLMNAIVDSLTKSISHEEMKKVIDQSLIKETADSISTAIAFISSADSVSDIYEVMYNLFNNLQIDVESIILNVLNGMKYSVADTVFTTVVPQYKIITLVDQILESAWPLTDYSYNLERGKMEIHVTKHGLQNFVANSSVTVTQQNNFSDNTVLDAYAVVETDEFTELSDSIPKELTNYTVYNITLRDKGMEVQPSGEIEVRIPVPLGAVGEKCVVYRIEENGDTTLLSSVHKDGFLTFTTSHLSYYIIGEIENSEDSPVKNGIDSIYILIAVIVIFAIVGLCVLVIFMKHKKKNK